MTSNTATPPPDTAASLADLALVTWIRRANDVLGYDVYPVAPPPPPTERELDEQRRSDEWDRAHGFDPDDPDPGPEHGPLTVAESARQLRWELSSKLDLEADKLRLELEDPEEDACDRYQTFRNFEHDLGKALISACVPLDAELTIPVDGSDVTFRNCSDCGAFVVRMVGPHVQMRDATPREFVALWEHRSNEYRTAARELRQQRAVNPST